MTELRRRLGSRIRTLRLAASLTQTGFAQRAGLSYKFIGEVERGSGNPTVASLDAIARALGIPVSHLFESAERTDTAIELTESDFAALRDAVATLTELVRRIPQARPRGRRG